MSCWQRKWSRLWTLILLSTLTWADEEAENATWPCLPNLSLLVPIEEAQLLEDGSLRHGDTLYPAGLHFAGENSSRRACPCGLAASKPCLRKCCPMGQRVADELGEEACEPEPGNSKPLRLPGPQNVKAPLEAGGIAANWFRLVGTSTRCDAANHGFIELHPHEYPEDEYELLANGSMHLDSQGTLEPGAFCLDRQSSAVGGLVVLVCLPMEQNGAAEPVDELGIARVGCTISAPFLLITLLVYALIPELRNIYGQTLMCYVAALFVAYSSMSASYYVQFGITCHVLGK